MASDFFANIQARVSLEKTGITLDLLEGKSKRQTQYWGEWLDKQTSLVLMVPSVIVPEEMNLLLNPAHADIK